MRRGARGAETLVGRDAEIAAVEEAVADACAGRLQVVLLEGPPGIGKTRLLEAALDRARDRGLEIAAGRSDELGSTRPFGVLADALGCTRGATDPQRAAIAERLLDDAAHRDPLGSGAPHFRVAEDFGDLLEALAVDGPVALALDDLQWTDPSTLYTLGRLTRRLADLPVLLAGALRPLPRSPELRRLIDRCIDEGALHLALVPLGHDDVVDLAHRRLGAEPGEGLAAFLDGAGGNPLFVGELVDSLVADGAVALGGGSAELTARTLPPDLRLTILRRIGFLSDGALRLLRIAAVLGQTFFAADLGAVAHMPTVDVMAAVDEWVAAGLVVPHHDALGFRHDVIREALHDDMPEAMRAALHLDAARALQAARAPITRVAQHYAVAASPGDPAAIKVLREAARVSVRDPRTRVELLRRAAELTDERAEGDEITAELADALVWADTIEEGGRLASELLERDPNARLRRKARLTLAYALWLDVRWDELITLTSRWLEEGGTLDDTEHAWLELYRGLVRVLVSPEPDEVSVAAAQEALAVGERRDDDGLQVLALVTLMFSEQRALGSDAALTYGLRAVAIAERTADPQVHRFNPYMFAAAALQYAGRGDEAEAMIDAGARVREATGALWSLPTQLANAAIIYANGGRLDAAAAAARAALDVADERGIRFGVEVAHGVLCSVSVWRGDFDDADERVRAAHEAAAGTASGDVAARAAIRVRVARGEVEATLPQIAREFTDVRYFHVPFAVEVVPAVLAAGEPALARHIVEKVEALSGGRPYALDPFVAFMRALVEDDPDAMTAAAPRTFETGFFQAALAAEHAAGLLARHGRPAQAAELFGLALQRYEEAGARWLSARLHASMRAGGLRPPRRYTQRRATTGWDALTEAERTVAALAAQGLTNPQIADRLVVARSTVHTHVSHALAKLGLSSRVQLAAEVARAGWDANAP